MSSPATSTATSCSTVPPPSTASAATTTGAIHTLHEDILWTEIFPRLDGTSLALASCTSSQFRTLASNDHLWTDVCHSTWPSTASPRVRHLISTFSGGHRSFFSQSYITSSSTNPSECISGETESDLPSEIISAVDVTYRGKPILNKAVETETESAWFRSSPFRIDVLEPKDAVSTAVSFRDSDDTCRDVSEGLRLSWILIDPKTKRSVNLSSYSPFSVQRHWLSGEVHARFGMVQLGERESSAELVQCVVLVTCGWSRDGEMQVKEVSLQVEDVDGMYLNGRDSLVILQKGFGGRVGRNGKGRVRVKLCEEFVETKWKRKEKKLRREGTLDILCVGFGVLISAVLLGSVLL